MAKETIREEAPKLATPVLSEDISDKARKAFLKELNKIAAKEKARRSSKCFSCPGFCCKRFWIKLAYKGTKGHERPDWARMIKAATEVENTAELDNINFIHKHFKREHTMPWMRRGWYEGDGIRVFTFTCTAFKDGKCSMYKARPPLCKAFMCSDYIQPQRQFPLQARLLRKEGVKIPRLPPGLKQQELCDEKSNAG